MKRAIASWFPATVEVVDAESYDALAAEVATLKARLAEAADWIATAHQTDCSIFWRNSTACNCGRDALYHRICTEQRTTGA